MNVVPRITVVGSINMDLVVQCQRIPQAGETILARSASEICGGKGANQAVAAALAGASVSLVGRVGRDAFRDRLLNNLRVQNVDITHVRTDDHVSSGLAVISVEESGQNAITVVPGANGRVTASDVRDAESVIRSSDLLMLQLEIPIDAVMEAIRIARQCGVRVMLDPAPAPNRNSRKSSIADQSSNPEKRTDFWDDDLLTVDFLCPNESEAADLVGHGVDDLVQAEAAARTLHARGAANVAITMGDRGVMVFSEGRATMIPAFQVSAVDTTAAGDAFAGAFAVAWAEAGCQTANIVDAVQFASAAGALAACTHGAQPSMATRDRIEELWRTR
ncbi:ribokinase [Neorhodopirellula pilleata]|uniref:Ribokinase n=1 Tax=Neorhodopirellula pilleata TaxID=2714738 RepID=A0A5C6AQ54_9BACT|nr:ribokinase [Neorhodopirellula pilleata]TWU01359.1 Ribokinase [Neorhodopirellula pilleata]